MKRKLDNREEEYRERDEQSGKVLCGGARKNTAQLHRTLCRVPFVLLRLLIVLIRAKTVYLCFLSDTTHCSTACHMRADAYFSLPSFSTGFTNVCGPCAKGLTGTAGNGNTACVDDQPPVITGCPPRQRVFAEDGMFTAKAVLPAPRYSENYKATVTYEPPSGSIFRLGETLVTVNVTDIAGSFDSCTFVVSVRRMHWGRHSGVSAQCTCCSWRQTRRVWQA